MEICTNIEDFSKELIEEANKVNILLNSKQIVKLYNYMKLLLEWNKKINLTAITDEKEIIASIRFAFIILGTFFGFIGISVGLFGYIGILSSCSSFGVPYLSPYVPITLFNNEGYFLSPIWKREKRQDSLNTKRKFKESHISKLWQNSKHN